MFEKNNIKFQQDINRAPVLVASPKLYFSWKVSNEDTFYVKIVAVDEICKFLVFKFFIWDR
jgi:hypothetical protein